MARILSVQALGGNPGVARQRQVAELVKDEDGGTRVVLRHHGLPTRLLDWSESIWIATFSAASTEWDSDGIIWIFDRQLFDQQVREAGLHARMSYKTTRNPGKLIKDASAARARFAVILGEDSSELDKVHDFLERLGWSVVAVVAVALLAGSVTAQPSFADLLNETLYARGFERPTAMAFTPGASNGSSTTMIDENPGIINSAINGNAVNDAGYDLGHVVGIGPDGGNASRRE